MGSEIIYTCSRTTKQADTLTHTIGKDQQYVNKSNETINQYLNFKHVVEILTLLRSNNSFLNNYHILNIISSSMLGRRLSDDSKTK